MRRFKQEAEAASALNHPNILTIHDIGHEAGVAFIVMEWVQGQTLRDLLAGGLLPPRRLAPIAHRIAEGLAQAHAAGIVHRDLKPENIMLSDTDRAGIGLGSVPERRPQSTVDQRRSGAVLPPGRHALPRSGWTGGTALKFGIETQIYTALPAVKGDHRAFGVFPNGDALVLKGSSGDRSDHLNLFVHWTVQALGIRDWGSARTLHAGSAATTPRLLVKERSFTTPGILATRTAWRRTASVPNDQAS